MEVVQGLRLKVQGKRIIFRYQEKSKHQKTNYFYLSQL